MASVSASTLVIFIAAVSIAVAVSGTMVDSVAGISESIDDRGVEVSQRIDTDVEIISDAGSDAVYGNGTITLVVKNTGSRTLAAEPGQLDVLVDGRYVPESDLAVSVYGGGPWRGGEAAELTIERTLATGEHRVVVIVGGERELFRFYV